MKKITLLFSFVIFSLGYAQTLPIDFSVPGDAFSWDPSGGVGGTTAITGEQLEIVGNGNQWDNAFILFSGADVVDLSMETANTISFTMQSTTAPMNEVHEHRIKIGTTMGVYEEDISTVGQEIKTFFINPPALGDLNEFRIFVDSGIAKNPNSDTGTYLVDNIEVVADPAPTCSDGIQNGNETGIDCGGPDCDVCPPTCSDGIMNGNETGVDCGGPDCDACPTPPTMAAPAPPARPAADVVSIYSGAYAAIPGINYDAGFCGTGATTEITVEGDAIFGYNNQNCQGIDYSANTQDITGLTHIHVDLFIQGGTDLVGKVFNMIVVGPDGAGQDTTIALDLNAISPAPVPGTWYSYDAAVAFNATTIRQFTIASNLKDIVWYDNLYLHKDTVLSTDEFSKDTFSVYPNPTQDRWIINSENTAIQSISVYNVLGKKVLALKSNKDQATIDASGLKAGIYFAKINTLSGNGSLKLVKQ